MRQFLLVTSALASVSFAVPAYAQSAEEEANNDDVIIVTARKREENLIDVPLPVTVATEAQLKRDQVYNLNDLTRITPALEISQTSGGETNGGGRLRGVGTGVFNQSVASSVALVVDQAPIGNLAFPQLYDIGQIEVLRGPQGTLFGQGASAGVLNVTTKAPSTDAPFATMSVDFADKGTAGSEVGELVFNGAFNVPLSDQAAIRVATQYKRETGLQRSVTTDKDNVITDYGVRVKALFKPSERFTVNLSAEYGRNESDGQTFFAIAIAPNATFVFDPPGPVRGPGPIGVLSTNEYLAARGCNMSVISARAEEYCEALPSYNTLKIGSFGAVLDWEVSDTLSLTSVTSYRERSFNQYRRDFSRIIGNAALGAQAAARSERNREDSRGFSQELRANISSDSFDLVIGAFYADYKFETAPIGTGPFAFGVNTTGNRIGFSVCPPTGIGFCPVSTNFTKTLTQNRTLAGFADATVNLSDQFEIFGGLRVSDYKNSTFVQVFRATPGPASNFPVSESNVSGRIGASFKPSPDTNIYVSYAKGYKPTAVGTNVAGSPFQLKSETADAFELGVKGRLGRVQLSANAFYSKLKNFQSQRSEFAGTQLVSVPFNVPTLKSKGFELNAFGQIMPGLNLNAGYQFNVIKYPNGVFGDDAIDTNGDQIFDANVIAGLPFELSGTQFLNAPKHKFTISGEYSAALGESLEMFVNANLIYKTKVLLANRADPRYRYPAHEIINVGFGIRHPDGNWNASVFVRNLTKEREPTAYLASTFSGPIDGGIRAWPVSGLTARVVGVRAGFEF